MARVFERLDEARQKLCTAFHTPGANVFDVARQQQGIAQEVLQELLSDRRDALTFLLKRKSIARPPNLRNPVQDLPTQSIEDAAKAIADAACAANKPFKKTLRGLDLPQGAVVFGPVKTVAGITRKLENNEPVFDPVRCTIKFSNENELDNTLRKLGEDFELICMKNKFESEWKDPKQPPCLQYTFGFKNAKLPQNVQRRLTFGAHYIVEIQFTLEVFLQAKDRCHALYEILRGRELPRGCPVCKLPQHFVPRADITETRPLDSGRTKNVSTCKWKKTGDELVVYSLFTQVDVGAKRAAFERECGIWAPLDNPNVVRVLGIVNGADELGFLTNYATGGTLDACKNQVDPWDASFQVCDGLHYLHSHNVVHYDLSLYNILCYKTDDLMVLKIHDFDLARLEQTATPSPSGGKKFGISKFSAPELCAEIGFYDRSADLYSLGCVFLVLFHPQHKSPWETTDNFQRKVNQGELPPEVHEIQNREVREIIKQCMRHKASARPTVKKVKQMLLNARNRDLPTGQVFVLEQVGANSEQDINRKISAKTAEMKDAPDEKTRHASRAVLDILERARADFNKPEDHKMEDILQKHNVGSLTELEHQVDAKRRESQSAAPLLRDARRDSLAALEADLRYARILANKGLQPQYVGEDEDDGACRTDFKTRVRNDTPNQIRVSVYHHLDYLAIWGCYQEFPLAPSTARFVRAQSARFVVNFEGKQVAHSRIAAQPAGTVVTVRKQGDKFVIVAEEEKCSTTALQVVQQRTALLDIWESENFYQVLGVASTTAPLTDIRQAYHRAMMSYHPDKNPSEEATLITQYLNRAWKVLSNPVDREKYNKLLHYNRGWFAKAKATFLHRGWKVYAMGALAVLAFAGGIVCVALTAGAATPLVIGVGGAVGGGLITGGANGCCALLGREAVMEGVQFSLFLRKAAAGFFAGAIGGAVAAPISWCLVGSGPAMASASVVCHVAAGAAVGAVNGFTFGLLDGLASGRINSKNLVQSLARALLAAAVGAVGGCCLGAISSALIVNYPAELAGNDLTGMSSRSLQTFLSQTISSLAFQQLGQQSITLLPPQALIKALEKYIVVDFVQSSFSVFGRAAVNTTQYRLKEGSEARENDAWGKEERKPRHDEDDTKDEAKEAGLPSPAEDKDDTKQGLPPPAEDKDDTKQGFPPPAEDKDDTKQGLPPPEDKDDTKKALPPSDKDEAKEEEQFRRVVLPNLADAVECPLNKRDLKEFWSWISTLKRADLSISQWCDRILFFQTVVNTKQSASATPTHVFRLIDPASSYRASRMAVQVFGPRNAHDQRAPKAIEYFNVDDVCVIKLEPGETVRVWFEVGLLKNKVTVAADVSIGGLLEYEYHLAKTIQRWFTLENVFGRRLAKIHDERGEEVKH